MKLANSCRGRGLKNLARASRRTGYVPGISGSEKSFSKGSSLALPYWSLSIAQRKRTRDVLLVKQVLTIVHAPEKPGEYYHWL